MRCFKHRRWMLLVWLLACAPALASAQEKIFKGKILDNGNNQYNLNGLKVSGGTAFHCRLQDTVFTLDFEKIRSLAVNTQAASPFKGFFLADIVLSDGRSSRAYVDLDNYWLEGVEDIFNIKIKIKLADVLRLDVSTEVVPPSATPSPTHSPAPSTLSAPTAPPSGVPPTPL